MKKINSLLVSSATVLLSFAGAMSVTSVFSAPVPLSAADIKAAKEITSNRSISVVAESILPKSNDFSGEDELPIPEGVRPIQGMNIPLRMKEIIIHGLDHKAYGATFLRKALANATKYHSSLAGAPKNKNTYKVSKKGNTYVVSMNDDVFLAFVYALAQEITGKYQSDQFLLARAIVPEQKIDQTAGSVEICVAEGYLAVAPTIVLPAGTKNPERFKVMLAPHLNKLTKMKPLDFKVLERSLLLIRDMSGVEVKTTFKQAPKQTAKKLTTNSICAQALKNGAGATALEVRADLNRITGEVSIDNFGTESLGPEIAHFKVGANSIFKAGDTYQLKVGNALDAGETLNFAINAQIPIGTNGLKGKLFYSKGAAEPGGFAGLNVVNNTNVLGVSVEYPYIRSRKKNLTFEVGLRSHNVKTTGTGGGTVLEDSNLNTLRLRSTYDFSDKYNGVNLMSIGLVAGLSGDFDEKAVTGRNDLKENFVMVRGELARYQAIQLPQKATGNLTWVNSLSWQYTNDALFSSEEFALGGRDFGRGFDLAVITGDQAVAVKTEIQYANKNKYGKYKTYGFVDHGRVKNLDKIIDPKDINQDLTSAGIGIEFEADNNWFAKIELAKPIDISVDTVDVGARTYLQIGYRW